MKKEQTAILFCLINERLSSKESTRRAIQLICEYISIQTTV